MRDPVLAEAVTHHNTLTSHTGGIAGIPGVMVDRSQVITIVLSLSIQMYLGVNEM